MIGGTQPPVGARGVLFSDLKLRDVELYLEVKADWGNDSAWYFGPRKTVPATGPKATGLRAQGCDRPEALIALRPEA